MNKSTPPKCVVKQKYFVQEKLDLVRQRQGFKNTPKKYAFVVKNEHFNFGEQNNTGEKSEKK